MQISALLPNRINAQISLQPQSRFIGITGPSGAGKSSLFRALAGVEKSAKVQMPWTSQKVGIVFQQPMLFPHTDVRGNLALAQRHASPNAMSIDVCLRGCYCEHLIDKPVQALSGGEAQRVAIARTLLKDPPIVILDEATSALDSRTEQEILKTLKSVARGRTTLAIAHRLSTIADSDRILVLENGRLAEQGRHAELLRRDGLYAEMWARQQADSDA